MFNKLYITFLAVHLALSTTFGIAAMVHEQIDEQESISSFESEIKLEELQIKETPLEEIKELAQEYIKDVPHFKELINSTEPLVLLKNIEEKRALAILEIPKESQIPILSYEEQQLIKELFQTYRIEKYRDKLFIAFAYQDKDLLPETKEQAIYLLLAAYCLDDANTHKGSQLDGILNKKQATALGKKEYKPRSSKPLINQKLKVTNTRTHEGLCPSTRVKTSVGHSALKDLQIGDMVACYDELNKHIVYSPITHTDRIQVNKHISITINGQELKVAPQHKFYVAQLNEWVTAEALLNDANLCSYLNPDIQDVELVNEKLEVTRITVNSHHNFFITDNNILVHNYIPIVVEVFIAFEIGQGAIFTWAILAPTAMAIATGLFYWVTSKAVLESPPDLLFSPLPMQDHSGYFSADNSIDIQFERNNSNQKSKQPSGRNNNAGTPNKDPENDTERKQNEFITTKEATEAAEKLGFQKIKEQSEGRPVYKNGNNYITPDRTRHNGGFWKMANSVEGLKSRHSRLGTFDISLNRVGN